MILIEDYLLRGASAYELAVDNGFRGTLEERLKSLEGTKVVARDNHVFIHESDYIAAERNGTLDGDIIYMIIKDGTPLPENNNEEIPIIDTSEFFRVDNLFGELVTEEQKATARRNLGITGSMVNPVLPVWRYTTSANPSKAFYGQNISSVVTCHVDPLPPYSDNMEILLNGRIFNTLDASTTVSGIASSKNVSLSIDTSITEGKPEKIVTSIPITFSYKLFWHTDKDATLKEIGSNMTVGPLDDEYLYIIITKNTATLSDVNFDFYTNAFGNAEYYTLPRGSFEGQTQAVSGYYRLRTQNKLDGLWKIKI